MGAPLEQHAGLIYQIALGVLFLALAISAVTDIRSRLIYNWVTGPSFVIELVLMWLAGGVPGLKSAGLGLLVVVGPLFVIWIINEKIIALGDLKLLAVVSVVAGFPGAVAALVYISIAGGVEAVGLWIFEVARGRPRPKYVPYGVAIAAGTFAAWLTNR